MPTDDDTLWHRDYDIVANYHATHGTLQGLSTAYPSAARWLHRQRLAADYFAEHQTLAGLDDAHPASAKQLRVLARTPVRTARARLNRLAKIPGALPDRVDTARLVDQLARWLAENESHTLVGLGPNTTITIGAGESVPAGALVEQARQAHAAGKLPGEQIIQLQSLPGWTWQRPTREEIFYAELDWWVQEHGTANVPQLATSRLVDGRPYPLGRAVATRRLKHKAGKMPTAQARELASRTGWVWNAEDARWKARYADLEKYVQDHKSLDNLHANDPSLHAWLAFQVAAPTLSAERRQALSRIPGAFSDRRSRVSQFVSAAAAWLEANPGVGAADMPSDAVVEIDGQQVPVGRRASYYRVRFADGKLSPEAIAQIESLRGWSWDLKVNRRG